MKGFFITGSDTGCGKTHVACALINFLRKRAKKVAPFKPVAAGAMNFSAEKRNEDAVNLIRSSGINWDYGLVNPYCFSEPISPHLTAKDDGITVNLNTIIESASNLSKRSDILVAEGAGGWMVPISDNLDVADIAEKLNLPVIMVVGLRLGCLNHARLTERAILGSQSRLLGWVATQVDPKMMRVNENIHTLENKLTSPCLGKVFHGKSAEFKETLILEYV
tara:strand:- start:1992 stop:2654 length:663 start_codon:yes stop_codon:yes gene_type:complete